MAEKRPTPNAPYRFSSEEMRVIQECTRESFYQRCLPLSTALGASTYYFVKTGVIKGNPKFGAVPKVIVAVIGGYFLGKISYQAKCAEKLMALPDSKMGAALRARMQQGGSLFQETLSLDDLNVTLPTKDTFSDIPSDVGGGPTSHMNIDTQRPLMEFDDYKPAFSEDLQFDNDHALPAQSNRTTSYEELRRQNREEYELKRTKPYRGVVGPEDMPSGLKKDTPSQPPVYSPPKGKNQYGDEWDK